MRRRPSGKFVTKAGDREIMGETRTLHLRTFSAAPGEHRETQSRASFGKYISKDQRAADSSGAAKDSTPRGLSKFKIGTNLPI